MKLAFLDESSTFKNKINHKLYEEIFKSPAITTSDYLEAGEIMARFLRIDINSKDSILNFFDFCVNSSYKTISVNDELINKINNEQQEIREFIEHYNNLDILYNKETSVIKRGDNSKEKEDIILNQLRSHTLPSLIKKLNIKTPDVLMSYATHYKNKPFYYMNSNNTISKKKLQKTIDLQQYVAVREYASQDIFVLIWVEIGNLFVNERKIEKCQCCGNYYVKNGANKLCIFCKCPISQMKADELKSLNIEEYNKRKLLKTINKYIQRNTANKRIILNYLHKKLEENKDIAEHVKLIEALIIKHSNS